MCIKLFYEKLPNKKVLIKRGYIKRPPCECLKENKMNKEQSLENYLYWKNKSEEDTYCQNCGSRLGGDCGDAEPDFNEQFCSKGCYKKFPYHD
jgi:hypothetical protein